MEMRENVPDDLIPTEFDQFLSTETFFRLILIEQTPNLFLREFKLTHTQENLGTRFSTKKGEVYMNEQRIDKKGEDRRIPLSDGPAVSLSGRSGARHKTS